MLRKAVPHATIILSIMMMVFFIIDRVNTAFAALNNDISDWLLAGLCVCAATTAVYLIIFERRHRR
ncbi:MAG: hypothetical protein PHO66_08405 [Eubacteriales bacterium]|nr:hypothetical protein [Eubacteriales bacterium]